ncbi:hypothetical protein VST7929_01868 [Vibrio stylophorae]|uniref:Conjugal transfer protein TraF n=1 Tax=Vibrio stylophorae TaxID=659351 RepID=A0ABM8ZUI4_9VIBR|nr:conjugal transfer protein TraF [Vibrio stylophorae]CAH0533986.1 hypothetical protein VST7929_01868 [Vibrio stylophorae]
MNKLGVLSLTAAVALATSNVQAAVGHDSRSMAMGGIGVASASYLTAPFYNPAQLANHNETDDIGFLIPTIAFSVHDKDDLVDKIDTIQMIDPEQDPDAWVNALKSMENSTLQGSGKLGTVLAVPGRSVSVAFYTQNQLHLFVQPTVSQEDIDNPPSDPMDMESEVWGLAGGTLDFGIALAKAFHWKEHQLSIGVTPKLQTIYLLNYLATPDDYDIDDFDIDDHGEHQTHFNLDAGISYQPVPQFTLAFAARNLIEQSIHNEGEVKSATYLVEPSYSVGASFDNDWFLLSFDWDLTEQRYFKEVDYSTQFARIGLELNAWDWAQIRAGYAASQTDTADDMITAGIGLTPFGAFGLDIAAQYGEDNQYAASAQLLFTF